LRKLKSNAINYLNPAHKSGDAWVRIASSVQSRGGRPLILECASCQDCTLEAMRTQPIKRSALTTGLKSINDWYPGGNLVFMALIRVALPNAPPVWSVV
jgi:hypothetical protein